jgi:hypothetical protein
MFRYKPQHRRAAGRSAHPDPPPGTAAAAGAKAAEQQKQGLSL